MQRVGPFAQADAVRIGANEAFERVPMHAQHPDEVGDRAGRQKRAGVEMDVRRTL